MDLNFNIVLQGIGCFEKKKKIKNNVPKKIKQINET